MDRETALCLQKLGLANMVSPEDIKKKWKSLCKKHHPDVGGNEEVFHDITRIIILQTLRTELTASQRSSRILT
jgi:curved DNA-binding protein CbpA